MGDTTAFSQAAQKPPAPGERPEQPNFPHQRRKASQWQPPRGSSAGPRDLPSSSHATSWACFVPCCWGSLTSPALGWQELGHISTSAGSPALTAPAGAGTGGWGWRWWVRRSPRPEEHQTPPVLLKRPLLLFFFFFFVQKGRKFSHSPTSAPRANRGLRRRRPPDVLRVFCSTSRVSSGGRDGGGHVVSTA